MTVWASDGAAEPYDTTLVCDNERGLPLLGAAATPLRVGLIGEGGASNNGVFSPILISVSDTGNDGKD